jgi:hypothetical protein
MSEATFQVAYDGEGIVSGTIDVRVLAPALLSLGELVKSSNQILNGDSATTSLRVTSDFQSGSFEVSLLLTQNFLETVKTLFPREAVDAAGLFAAIFGAAKYTGPAIQGLLNLYKLLKGEKPRATLADQSSRTTIFVMGSGNEVHVEKSTAQLYADDRIMGHVDQVVRPISERALDSLEVKKGREVIDRLERDDLPQRLLEPWPATFDDTGAAKLDAPPREVLLRITKPNFEGGRWSFTDGQAKFGAEITDEAFNEKVKRREEGFFAGDTLHALMRTTQRIVKDNKLEVSHTVERVIEHMHAPRQENLLRADEEGPPSGTAKRKFRLPKSS